MDRRRSSGRRSCDDFGLEHALRFSYKLLGYRPRSVREMRDRLKLKGFSDEIISAAMDRLAGLGYLNDETLARHLKLKAEDGRMLGKAGARAYMGRLGIPKQLTEEALEVYDESAGAESLVRKKLGTMRRGEQPEKVRQRISQALRRRGFSGETIRSAMKKIDKEDLSE